MQGKLINTGQRYSASYCVSDAPSNDDASDYWDNYEEMKKQAERLLENRRFKPIILYERGGEIDGWGERERLTP